MKEKIINTMIKLKNVFITLFIISSLALAGRSDYEDTTGTSFNDGLFYIAFIILGVITAYVSIAADRRK